jgi:hypothetical protein
MMVEEETVKLKERSMFFRFARQHCCNYSERGPLEKRHYCWLGPPKTNSICVLLSGGSCGWFVKAVLPLDKALEAEWHRLRLLKSDPSPTPGPNGSGLALAVRSLFPTQTDSCGARSAAGRTAKRYSGGPKGDSGQNRFGCHTLEHFLFNDFNDLQRHF